MNNKQFLKKAYAAAMVAVMVCSSSALFAQVKIGSNPTSINAANNLEVEAANGNKTVIQKANGNVGVGTSTPNNKLEISSGITNTSGLRFTNLNANSPINPSVPSNLGVDANGDVVIAGKSTCIPDYLLAVGGAYTNAPAGQNVTGLTDAVALQGIVSPSAGVFTLKAGNSYRLESALFSSGLNNGAGSGFIYYTWYNNDTNTKLAIASYGRSTQVNASGYDGSQPVCVGFITPSVDTNVSLRMIINNGQSGELQIYGQLSYLSITQMNPCR
ncbi:hypothetical protein [Dyadobacter frigoris]|uniref:Uncharacterized protein n=1 Tax=Dyadobacter frigoris TaxID=2576211 RepID=A0A4U6D4B9_9BACT|nr:hypothetical protein [Dyadobacter frigoris]TKT91021.1 hypothetical protein FDK13_18890 [Dyadobacter frigoris]GLU56216.1 hypothetical protein Dfri01_56770 [Dyadobacter frigoris]